MELREDRASAPLAEAGVLQGQQAGMYQIVLA